MFSMRYVMSLECALATLSAWQCARGASPTCNCNRPIKCRAQGLWWPLQELRVSCNTPLETQCVTA